MTWKLDADRPVYAQLIEQIELRIISGMYPAGSKLPSVRDLANEASVNPNTMQRALGELERGGLLYSQRTTGRFVTEDRDMIKQAKGSIAAQKIQEFLEAMKALGFDNSETLKMMQNATKELK